MTDRYKESIQGARDCVEKNKDGGVYLPDLLRIIDNQQAEIERLTKKLLLRIEENDCLRNYIGIQAEEQAAQIIANYKGVIKTAKAEAIKEFAERAKGKFAIFRYVSVVFYSKVISIIDNLVKEMVGK